MKRKLKGYELGTCEIIRNVEGNKIIYETNVSGDYFAFTFSFIFDSDRSLVSYDEYYHCLNVGVYAFELIDFIPETQYLIGKLVKPT